MKTTSAQRKAAERDRKHAAGLVLLTGWVRAEDAPRARAYLARLRKAWDIGKERKHER